MATSTPIRQAKLFKTLSVKAARAADDKKGGEIVLLHIHPVSSLADYLLIVSINSPSHMKAVEESVRKALKEAGVMPHHNDGKSSELWRVLDYGGLLVHLMHPRAREFYALDKLFHDAKRIRWDAPARKAKASRVRVKRSSRKVGAHA